MRRWYLAPPRPVSHRAVSFCPGLVPSALPCPLVRMPSPPLSHDAALRRLAADVSPARLGAVLADAVAHARDALGAQAAALVPFDRAAKGTADAPESGPVDAPRADALAARVQASGAPEALSSPAGDDLAVAVEGLFGTWGALVVQGLAPDDRPDGSGDGPPPADRRVHLLRVAALAGRCVAHQQAAVLFADQDARARAILETTVDGIITIDPQGTMLAFNQAAERLFQVRADDMVGRNVSVLMPEPDHSRHDGYLRRYLETGERRIIGIGREVVGRRADGSTFPMELAVSEVQLDRQRLFTGIVRDLSERRALEQEVLRVSDEERRRIGQDLHDGLGQMLSGIALISSGLARKMRPAAPDAAEDVEEIAGLVREADTYARTLARSLVPVELAQGGLPGALERLADSARRLFGLDVALTLGAGLDDLHIDVALHLYRIAQEAVSNAVRHGGAAHVTLSLTTDAHATRLTVADDGKGFAPSASERPGPDRPGTDRPARGLGLRIMQHRARLIGASLEVTGAPGQGVTVSAVRLHPGAGLAPGGPKA